MNMEEANIPIPKGDKINNELPENNIKEINATIDLTKKPQSKQETIDLLNDDELDKEINKKTEGDIKSESTIKNEKQILANKNENVKIIDVAEQQAEAWVKVIDMAIRFCLKLWSGQADNTGLTVAEDDKRVFASQIAIALKEYKLVVPILLTIITTFGAMYATPFMNAKESKKKIDEFKRNSRNQLKKDIEKEIKVKPELDPSTGKHKKSKGGQFKS